MSLLLGRPILLSLLLASTAAAQEPTPLLEVPAARAPRPSLRDRLQGGATRLARSVPGLRGLAPPTTGTLRVAVVLAAFPDVTTPDFGPAEFTRSLFSRAEYTKAPDGARAYGSLADWYAEQSSGALRVEGRVFPWVSLAATREALEPRPLVDPTARRDLFTAALDALLAREGPRALEPFDALAFVVAGGWAGQRGSILWPHSSVLLHRGRPWRYYLMHAGSQGFEPIGVHCHELGHVLGLLDEYGVGGHDTGLGQWCAMADGADGGHADGIAKEAPPRTVEETARDAVKEQLEELRQLLEGLGGGRAPTPRGGRPARPGVETPAGRETPALQGRARAPAPRQGASGGLARPLHLCAPCKERLGWATPRTIDPRTSRRIALSPVEGDGRQVARVLLDPAGREALVLEYRGGAGFDAGLPRTGLLVWRTGDPLAMVRTFVPFLGHELVPAHGVASTDAAERAPLEVMFPTPTRREVVVRGSRRGAFAVRLSGIEEKDGRLVLEVGLAN